jgi:hypothetical protein
MASQLSEFLHFAVTLLLATPSQLNQTYLQNHGTAAQVNAVLADYGFTADEIQAINDEILTSVNQKTGLKGVLSLTGQQIAGLSFYDGPGVHPNGAQANALVRTLRPIAVTPNV